MRQWPRRGAACGVAPKTWPPSLSACAAGLNSGSRCYTRASCPASAAVDLQPTRSARHTPASQVKDLHRKPTKWPHLRASSNHNNTPTTTPAATNHTATHHLMPTPTRPHDPSACTPKQLSCLNRTAPRAAAHESNAAGNAHSSAVGPAPLCPPLGLRPCLRPVNAPQTCAVCPSKLPPRAQRHPRRCTPSPVPVPWPALHRSGTALCAAHTKTVRGCEWVTTARTHPLKGLYSTHRLLCRLQQPRLCHHHTTTSTTSQRQLCTHTGETPLPAWFETPTRPRAFRIFPHPDVPVSTLMCQSPLLPCPCANTPTNTHTHTHTHRQRERDLILKGCTALCVCRRR